MPGFTQRSDGDDGADDAKGTVELAASVDAVDVRSGHNDWPGFTTVESTKQIPESVLAHRKASVGKPSSDLLPRLVPGVRINRPPNAASGQPADLVEAIQIAFDEG